MEGLNFGAFAISMATAPAIFRDIVKISPAMQTLGRGSAGSPGLQPRGTPPDACGGEKRGGVRSGGEGREGRGRDVGDVKDVRDVGDVRDVRTWGTWGTWGT